jgi:hypothetical protein
MTRRFIDRRATALTTVALILGAAGPAMARPDDLFMGGGPAPAQSPRLDLNMGGFQPPAQSPRLDLNMGGFPRPATTTRRSAALSAAGADHNASAVEYVLIGAGGASVALVGLGAIGMSGRRRRHTAATARPRVAA